MARIGNLSLDSAYARNSGFTTLTRIGLASKGIVYVLIGLLALLAALGEGGATVGSRGALARVDREPFGEVALFIVGVGLLCYMVWSTLSAFRDTEDAGSGVKGIAKRAARFLGGLAHAGLGLAALRLVFGDSSTAGDDSQAQSWTARLLAAPFGTTLVVLVGLGFVAGGIWQAIKGWKEKFRNDLQSLPPHHEWVIRAGTWGYLARGVVFAVIGIFLVVAAIQHDPSEARSVEGALDTLAAQPFGQVLLAVVAAGLACYGLYVVVESQYRKF